MTRTSGGIGEYRRTGPVALRLGLAFVMLGMLIPLTGCPEFDFFGNGNGNGNSNNNSNGNGNGNDNNVTVGVDANAGSDVTALVGDLVELDGSRTRFPGGATGSFAWSQKSGPNVLIDNADQARASFRPQVEGTYEFRLTASAGSRSDADDVRVTVESPTGSGASIAGRVIVTRTEVSGGSILEVEPNDTVDQAHNLGEIKNGDVLLVLGHTTAEDDTDPFDGFTLTAKSRMRITATLEFAEGAENDIDMFVYDPFTGQFVSKFIATTNPEIGVFYARGSFDLVIEAFRGESDYKLTIAAEAVDEIEEIEPNDAFGDQQYLGELSPGETIRIFGDASKDSDEFDGFIFSTPEPVDVTATLTYFGDGDLDLVLFDATVDLENAELIAAFDSTEPGFEEGSFTVAAMSLIELDVRAFEGAADWELVITATASSSPAMAPRMAPLTGQNKMLKRATNHFYGRPALPLVLGQMVLCPQQGVDIRPDLARRGIQVAAEAPGGPCCAGFPLPENADPIERARRTVAMQRCVQGCVPVQYVEFNLWRQPFREPNDEFYNFQWHYRMMQLPAAWDTTVGSDDVIVAVIDSGIVAHPDIVDRLIDGVDFISDPSISRDGDGLDFDPTDDGDLLLGNSSSFHGTHVAGTIAAASDNGTGVAGVTWNAKIMPLRALGKGGGTNFDIINAVLYAAGLENSSGRLPQRRADIINMSLGGAGSSQAEQDVYNRVRQQGVIVFAASGNENTSAPSFPASYANVISIGALDIARNRAPYSNFGPTLDLMAPGGDTSVDLNGDGYPDGVLSTMAFDDTSPAQIGFQFQQGTSMACPHAAGVAALMLAVNPNLTLDQILQIMINTADDLGAPGRDNTFGHGMINAAAAVTAASSGGGGNTGEPKIGLSRASVDFSFDLTEQSVIISNVGGQRLLFNGLFTTTQDGGDWLSAFANEISSTRQDFDEVVIQIERNGLPDGFYFGRVRIESNGGRAEVQVSMEVSSDPNRAQAPDIDIFVLAVDVKTFETIAQIVVNPRRSLAFRFDDLPAGSYFIIAGSDGDGDNEICESGDLCGAFPTPNEPQVLRVLEGESIADLVFDVANNRLDAGSLSAGTGGMILRLRN